MTHRVTEIAATLQTAEIQVGDFLLPWGMVIGALGFVSAFFVVGVMQRLGWTRGVWHLPAFFVAVAVLLGCVLGLLLAP